MPHLLMKARPAEPRRGCDCGKRPSWPSEKKDQSGQEKGGGALPEHDLGPLGLAPINRILQLPPWPPDPEAMNLMPGPFDRPHLVPGERMAYLRIEVLQIGKAH